MGLRVLIIGGGVGGLALAQGLHHRGVDVTVFERDETPRPHRQGYRIHIDFDGQAALRACLPPATYELLANTGNRPGRRVAGFTDQLVEVFAHEFEVPPDAIDGVNRMTMREALLAGLADVVQFGRTYERYELRPDGRVRAIFADGSDEVGDVLVGADGVNSRVRAQLLPRARLHDTGLRVIYGKIPLNAETRSELPPTFFDGFCWVMPNPGGPTAGHHFGFAPMQYRRPLKEVAAEHGPAGFHFTPQDDFMMCVYGAHRDVLGMSDEEFFSAAPEKLWAIAQERSAGFHPLLQRAVELGDPAATLPISIRTSVPIDPWPTSAVTVLGDALHTMPPTAGVGANTALGDANLLCEKLVGVANGKDDLHTALAAYEATLREVGFARVDQSLKQATQLFDRVDLP